MATDLANDPASTLQTIANPAPTTLGAGQTDRIVLSDAVTAAPSDMLTLEHGTSGTPVAAASAATAFGSRLLFKLHDTANNQQLAAGFNAFWRAVNAAVGGCAGSMAILAQSAGNFLTGLLINDYGTQHLKGTTTNPGLSPITDNRHGLGYDGSDRGFLGHTSVVVATWDSSAGVPRFAVNGLAPAASQAVGATLTNNVTAGGSANVIANYTDLAVYANDAAAIRNDIYQLSLKLAAIEAAGKLNGYIKT